MTIEEQESDSPSQTTTTQADQTSDTSSPVVSDKPLTGDELKAGMLAEINKGLGEVKEKSALDELEDQKVELKPDKEVKPKTDKEKKPEEKDDLYKMPDGLQKDSRARFQKLVDTAKQEKERANKAEAVISEKEAIVTDFRAILNETKTSSEDLSAMLEYNRLVKTGDLESALAVLDEQRSLVARMLGRPIEGVDVLDEFSDLKQEVTDGVLTMARAAEIAKARRMQEALQYQRQTQEQTQQQAGAKQKAVKDALSSIQSFAAEMAAKDVDYAKKEEILLKSVEAISSKFPADLWLDQVQMLYDNISVIPTPPAPRPTPLRPNSGGGGTAQPKSMLDAINNGLGYSTPA